MAAETFNSEDGPENKQSLKKEASSVVRSLSASHDVAEAVSQIRELKPSQRNQKGLFLEILKRAAEAAQENRIVQWQFTAQLFAEEVFEKPVLMEGLTQFMDEVYEDFKCDVPHLPKILGEELLPRLAGDVDGDGEGVALLDAAEVQQLTEKMNSS